MSRAIVVQMRYQDFVINVRHVCICVKRATMEQVVNLAIQHNIGCMMLTILFAYRITVIVMI
jgi:hypothetical protein